MGHVDVLACLLGDFLLIMANKFSYYLLFELFLMGHVDVLACLIA